MSTTIDLSTHYTPQQKQRLMHASPANELLVGGAAGPGKSMFLRWEALKWCLEIPGLHAYLFRRTFRELEDNHILPALVQFPREIGAYKEQKKRWEFVNGSMLHFCHCQYEKDVFDYLSTEIHLLLIDELTTFTEFIYDMLRGRVRCPLTIPEKYRQKIPGVIAATNPGGVGHGFCKRRWVDFAAPMELRRAPDSEGGMLRQYIPGLLADNPKLTEADPGYVHRIEALPEPYRTAYLTGDWEMFFGQLFAFNVRDHVIAPVPVPADASLYFTFDWGFGAPYHVGWWWVDADDRIYLFSELYGALPHPPSPPNTGVRQTDDVIADAVLARERELEITGRRITRLCDPTCFARKPDYRGGGQGPSTAEVFAGKGLILAPADASRILKVREFHRRLHVPEDGSRPLLQVYRCCEAFIRTIPMMQADPDIPDEVPLRGIEGHCYDSAAQICMARPAYAAACGAPRRGGMGI